MEKFQKTILLITLGRAAEPPYLANKLTTQSRNLGNHPTPTPPTTKPQTTGNHNQYDEPPGNPPYTDIYQYTKSPPTLHHSS